MAAPATHTVLACKIYNKYFDGMDFSKYIIGNNFPDIRYLGVIEREKTHFKDLRIHELTGLSPFMTGVKLHSLVDEVREKYMEQRGLYSFFPDSPLKSQAAKFFEDFILWEKIDNWSEVVASFDQILPEELEFGIPESVIRKWHGFLKLQLSHKPREEDLRLFTIEIGKPESVYTELLRVLHGMTDKDQVSQIVLDFYESFEELIS